MNIQKLYQIEKDEDRFIGPFIEFYLPPRYPELSHVEVESPDKDNTQSLPDYYLVQPAILVEVKGIHDRAELETITGWERKINALKKELNSRDTSLIPGSFLVDTNRDFRVPRSPKRIKGVIDQLLDAIKNDQSSLTLEETGTFLIKKINDQDHHVAFGFRSNFTFFDPADTVHQNTKSLIKKADKQLGLFEGGKVSIKILLLVNWYVFSDKFGAIFKALCRSYEELMISQNIDEIWLQSGQSDGTFEHDIVYTRDLLMSFDRGEISTDRTTAHLLGKWFFALTLKGDEYKGKAFAALNRLLEVEEPHHLFEDSLDREQMVELGSWLIEQERFADAIWLIDRFIDDPDPPDPEDYSGDPKLNHHQRIANGETSQQTITSVLGHLACVVQQLAVNDEYLLDALRYADRLLGHKNFYVKLEAILPLIEIAARRQLLDGYGIRPYQGSYKRFHDIAFDLVTLVENNPELIAIAEYLSLVFLSYTDLSTVEAELVLDSLKVTHESADLFVCFGIYRERCYQDQSIEFDQEKLDKKLRDMIKNNDEDYLRLRAGILYCFERILAEDPSEFDALQPYIDLFARQPLDSNLYRTLRRIIEKWIEGRPDVCIRWYKSMLSDFSKFSVSGKPSYSCRGLWIGGMKSIVEVIAHTFPNELKEVIERIVRLYERGVFNGRLDTLIDSLDVLQDEELRNEIVEELSKLVSEEKNRDLLKKG